MESKKIIVDIPQTTIDLGYSKMNFSYDEYDNLKIVWGSETSSEVLTFLIPKRVKTRKEIFKQFLKDFFKK